MKRLEKQMIAIPLWCRRMLRKFWRSSEGNMQKKFSEFLILFYRWDGRKILEKKLFRSEVHVGRLQITVFFCKKKLTWKVFARNFKGSKCVNLVELFMIHYWVSKVVAFWASILAATSYIEEELQKFIYYAQFFNQHVQLQKKFDFTGLF